jgi:hypothetical protein
MESWRDEKRLPLSELNQAMASYSADGQVDDATGGDAGAEQAGLDRAAEDRAARARAEAGGGDPDPDSEEGRRLRPSPEGGLSGPN